ncbi:MAG TPA: DUF2502 domain-containing protein [Denitromonas sp.]|uniref:DUF2502 domain-containing protein n=1 Tax=Denitromonas sp. TaxID=2734609 RepID=UPI002BE6B4B6|nr:DUF2502 domain-containing protein [Denitromonas sp.]HQV15435.1 DUF2502 domain-containing protein [Denitromonas sp.]
MKKVLLAAMLLAGASALTHASDVNIDIDRVRIQAGGVTISVGERDRRGYYWDGRVWRDPVYWKKHHPHDYDDDHRHKGKKGYHCPPGQAKKGNC